MPLIPAGTLVQTSDLLSAKGWTTYAPTIDGTTSYTASGDYIHLGEICLFKASILATTGSTGVGNNWEITLPVNASVEAGAALVQVAGSAYLVGSTDDRFTGTCVISDVGAGSKVRIVPDTASFTGYMGDTVPTATWWGDGSVISISGFYSTT